MFGCPTGQRWHDEADNKTVLAYYNSSIEQLVRAVKRRKIRRRAGTREAQKRHKKCERAGSPRGQLPDFRLRRAGLEVSEKSVTACLRWAIA